MAKQVQYPYALYEDNNLVFIKDVVKEQRYEHTYRCPNCGGEMLPRLGEHNEHCFAHAGNQKCGGESYLHKTAKLLLARRFNERSKPFKIGFSPERPCVKLDTCQEKDSYGCCRLAPEYKEYDLLDTYDLPAGVEVDILESDGVTHFTPDAMLRSSSPKRADIFIEVYYKHKVTKEKVQSGHQIIEIRVRDLSDLRMLEETECFKESKDIVFYNFKPLKVTPEEIEAQIRKCAEENDHDSEYWLPTCKQSRETKRQRSDLRRFIVYKSGKAYDMGLFEEELESHMPSALMDITYSTDSRLSQFDLLVLLAKADKRMRKCNLCSHCVNIENYLNEVTTWCNLGKNGTSRKGTFDPAKGIRCKFFEWLSESHMPGVTDLSSVDPERYSIWINPN